MVASIAQDMQIKVAIVDDDEGIRTSLAALIREEQERRIRDLVGCPGGRRWQRTSPEPSSPTTLPRGPPGGVRG